MVGRCFTTQYATANGIGHTGHPLALIVFPPLTQLFLNTYGWSGSMLLFGAIFLHLVVCGALIHNHERNNGGESYSPLRDVDAESDTRPLGDEEAKSDTRTCFDFGNSCSLGNFGLDILRTVPFWIGTIPYISNRLVNDLWVIYFVAHAEANGFSLADAVLFTSVAGVGNLLVKVLHGPIVDWGWIKLRPMIVLMTTVAMLCLFADPWMNTFWLMLINAVVFMGTSGALGSLIDLYTKDLLGADQLVNAFSWMGVMGGFATFGLGFFPGEYVM